MTSVFATSLAAFIHFILRMTIFLDPGSPRNPNPTHLETMPSYLNLISVLLLTNEYQLLPQRYVQRIAILFNVMVETVLSLVIIEFSMIFVWSQLEAYIETELKKMCTWRVIRKFCAVEGCCVTCCTILLSFGFFLLVAWTVDLYASVRNQVKIIVRNVTDFFDCSVDWGINFWCVRVHTYVHWAVSFFKEMYDCDSQNKTKC